METDIRITLHKGITSELQSFKLFIWFQQRNTYSGSAKDTGTVPIDRFLCLYS